ncbi:MAG: leucine-rich repeat protein, partial [Eubacterium sp.]|nr:leucine-rich repeat protein [Eubacterium sp.]
MKLKRMKQTIAIILSVLMLFATIPMTAMAADDEPYEGAEIIASGECGRYVEWKLNSLGTLFLERSGSNGATDDYPTGTNSPFVNDSRIKKIVVTEGVTYLGRMVFRSLPNLTEVVLEEGFKEMEYGIFMDCPLLTELELPSSFNKFTTVAPFYGSSIKKLTFKGNNLNTNTESGYAWDRFFSNADIYVPLPFTLNGVVLNTYEEVEQALAHNGNRVYCVNDIAIVKWKDYDGTVLETDENAVQGVIPTYDGETPSRASDNTN